MGIFTYSLIIALIGGIIIFVSGIKSGVKVKYKILFVLLGAVLAGLGLYGLITHFIGSF